MLDEPVYPDKPYQNVGELTDYITAKSFAPKARAELLRYWGRLTRRRANRGRSSGEKTYVRLETLDVNAARRPIDVRIRASRSRPR